jgi:DNA-directed RNA polymerase specialized sigma24 family protein
MKLDKSEVLQTATPGEVRAALLGLSSADSVRLKQIAKLRAPGTGMEWADLLNEAFARAMGGQRQWPIGVPFVAFIAQTMRSIASDERSSRDFVVSLDEVQADEGPGRSDGELTPSTDVTPERELSAKQQLGQVQALFKDDPVSLAILVATAEEMAPDAIQKQLGLSATQYASALRKIRRRLQTFSSGD